MNEFDNVHSCTFFARQKQGSKSTMPLWLLLILPLHRTLARLPQGQPAALARLPSTLSGTFNSSEKKMPPKMHCAPSKTHFSSHENEFPRAYFSRAFSFPPRWALVPPQRTTRALTAANPKGRSASSAG